MATLGESIVGEANELLHLMEELSRPQAQHAKAKGQEELPSLHLLGVVQKAKKGPKTLCKK